MADAIKITQEGLIKLRAELEDMKGRQRMEVAAKIKEALSFGDISENSEYDDAKNEQAQLETRISQLEKQLKNVIIIEESAGTDVVALGLKVTLLDIDMDEEEEYQIVGSTEADPMANRISDESPIGSAIMGKKVGDVVDITVPAGVIQMKITGISR